MLNFKITDQNILEKIALRNLKLQEISKNLYSSLNHAYVAIFALFKILDNFNHSYFLCFVSLSTLQQILLQKLLMAPW